MSNVSQPPAEGTLGAFMSRKFILTLFVMLLLTTAFILCGVYPALEPSLSTFNGGLITTLGIYLGINVTHKFTTGKLTNGTSETPTAKKGGK